MTEPSIAGREEERSRTEPESLRLRELSAVLTVGDLDRSLRFYVEGLGFTVRERWERDGDLVGVDLVAGSCSLGLGQDDGTNARDRAKGEGFRLFAETAQDLESLAQRLRSRGVEVSGPDDQPWGVSTVTVVDPDGFTLTFFRS
jgi:catechol 2,3-dioxygenase-like lactoylglutathione lyase family enzyme